jgi:tripartite-type tricarboxylate transporter receptor subunit TctC
MNRRNLLLSLSAALAAALPLAAAAAWPEKPIRIVVPYAAGGPTDAMARILEGPLREALGTPIIVDNVPGAAGAIGAQQVLRAPADGYTLFLGNNGPSAVTPLLMKNANFDPVKDFQPLSLVAKATMVLAVSKDVPANDMKSFVAYARSHPGKLNYASAGSGSLGHLGSELLLKEAGLQMTHIPYKGQAPTLTALIAGDVQMLLTTPTDAMRGQAATGKIKLIGVTSDSPSPFDPKVDLVQSAVPGYTLYSWFALLVKAGTPDDVASRLAKAINAAVANEDVRKRFAALGIVAEGSGPQQVSDFIKQDVSRWSVIIRERNIQAD